jgi:hypothetical protein
MLGVSRRSWDPIQIENAHRNDRMSRPLPWPKLANLRIGEILTACIADLMSIFLHDSSKSHKDLTLNLLLPCRSSNVPQHSHPVKPIRYNMDDRPGIRFSVIFRHTMYVVPTFASINGQVVSNISGSQSLQQPQLITPITLASAALPSSRIRGLLIT